MIKTAVRPNLKPRLRLLGVAVLVAAALLTVLGASRASAAQLLSASPAPDGTFSDSCIEEIAAGSGIYTQEIPVPASGYLIARLTGGSGDWDLAIFSKRSGEAVAAGATSLPDEVASGFGLAGERLIVQVCRRPGASGAPSLQTDLTPMTEKSPAPSLLRVQTPDAGDIADLQKTGVDITESVGPGYADVVAYGKDDRDALARAGLSFQTEVADLAKQSARQRAAEQKAADAPRRLAAGNSLPSGRTGTYRRLADYQQELKTLAEENPKLVRLFTLPEKTYEGRTVQGIEITRNPGVNNGKPIFMQMGVHHAREWPSGEHAIEWAYELLNDFKAGDKRAKKTMRKVRTVVVPIVNPDGFNASREAGELQGAAGGRSAANETVETVNILTHPVEYRRKNCRFLDDSEGGNCVQPDLGLVAAGVDPNRNYGGLWGGPGASTDPTAADYRGPGPFSEPETRNIQDFMSRNVVTSFITNHTFTGLVLRPPAIAAQGFSIDEPRYKKLGKVMASENGYENQASYQLYDTSGGTEDWAYYSTGAIGYTFEIGRFAFHPAYQETVDEWSGNSGFFDAKGGNRAAYWKASRFAMSAKNHALIKGQGSRKGKLILTKRFKTRTSPVLDDSGEAGDVQTFEDKLRYVARVRRHGRFQFHMNPSTRPIVAKSTGEKGAGPPSAPLAFSGSPTTTTPCADSETSDAGCWNDHPIVVPDQPGKSNATATVRIEWNTEVTDWDMKVFRDSDGDGSSEGETEEAGTSATGPSAFEAVTVANLEPGEKYVARVVNYAATESYDGTVTFAGPPPFQKAKKERWTLTCKNRRGKKIGKRNLFIKRGQVKKMNLRKHC